MKKISLTILALSILSVAAFSQGFYIRAGLGYAFAQAGQTLDGTGTPYSGSQTYHSNQNQTYNIKGASFSAGMQSVIGLGYMFSEHVGIQLDGGIGISNKKYSLSLDSVYVSGTLSNVGIAQQAKTPFILMPQLVLQSGGDKLNLYARFGLALPLNSKINEDEVVSNLPGTGQIEIDDFTFQIKNSFSLGFTGAAGVQYKLNDKVSIWGELSLLSMSMYIKESDVTAVTANGQSYPVSSVSPQVVKYSKNVTTDSTNTTQAAYSQPFSNVGVNVGVTFMLSHHERHSHGRRNQDVDPNQPYRRR